MKAFRILLLMMIISISGYTGIVGYNHGWDLFTVFFGDMAAMTWPGQFNFDFICFLALSGLWLAWRNNFTPGAMVLGLIGFVGGIMVLAPYLLFVSFQTKGDMKEILLGRERTVK